jgi:tRNA pseudouridine55 synthase
MDGIIVVNKPANWTSFDVVAKIRNLSGVKKVGHSGTLDPMATGVLPVFIGNATKLVRHFIDGDKGYMAEMVLGIKTDTLDATGEITEKRKVQCKLAVIESTLKKYLGEIEQIPPMHSAVKVNGERLYKLARRGITVERQPRKVKIRKIELLNYVKGENPKATFEVVCSKGTYIRQLASDIGDDLGCGAHLSKLMRTYAHPFHVTQAVKMETIVTLAKVGRLHSIVLPIDSMLDGAPQ